MMKKSHPRTAMEERRSQLGKFEVALIGFAGLAGFLGGIAFVIEGDFCAVGRLTLDPVTAMIHMWLLLIGVQGAFWAIVLLYMGNWIAALWPKGATARGDFLARVGLPVAAVAMTVAVLLALARLSKAPWWPPSKLSEVPIGNLDWFAAFGIFTAVVAVCGMFVVTWRMAVDADSRKDGVLGVDRFLMLYRFLDSFLLLAALILGLGVLATAVLREAFNESQTMHALPGWSAIVFGALYSAFLALYYGACRLQFLAQGNRLREALAGPAPKTRSGLQKWAEARASLGDLLRLRLHGLSAFGESFSVAIPFVTGIITSLLGGNA